MASEGEDGHVYCVGGLVAFPGEFYFIFSALRRISHERECIATLSFILLRSLWQDYGIIRD